jgi:hypothetical protein
VLWQRYTEKARPSLILSWVQASRQPLEYLILDRHGIDIVTDPHTRDARLPLFRRLDVACAEQWFLHFSTSGSSASWVWLDEYYQAWARSAAFDWC